MAFKMKGFSGFKKDQDQGKLKKRYEHRIDTSIEKEVEKAKAKNKEANEDPNELQGIDPDKFSAMLNS